MKAVKITNSFYEVGPGGYSVEKFKAGSFYPLDAESQRQVDRRNGEIVDVPDDADKAADAAAKAKVKADAAAADAAVKEEAAEAAAALSDGVPEIVTPAEIIEQVAAEAKAAK